MPVYNPGSSFTKTSNYGPRNTGIPGASTFHRGQDFAASRGTPIQSAADGVVNYSGTLAGYGNVVVVEHNIAGEKVYTLYGHMNNPSLLHKGDLVTEDEYHYQYQYCQHFQQHHLQ